MESHQVIGLAMIAAGLVDGGMTLWLPKRIPDENQRLVLRLALVASALVLLALGGLFFSGILGKR